MFYVAREILWATVGLITDFISFKLDPYFYIWFMALFVASLATTLIQKIEGTITYSKAQCVGINLLVTVLYLVMGVLLAKYFTNLEPQPIPAENPIVLYKISFLLSSAVIFVDIMLDRLRRGRTLSYSLEFLAGSVVCFLVMKLANQVDFINYNLTLFNRVLMSLVAGIYTLAMKYLLEYESHLDK